MVIINCIALVFRRPFELHSHRQHQYPQLQPLDLGLALLGLVGSAFP